MFSVQPRVIDVKYIDTNILMSKPTWFNAGSWGRCQLPSEVQGVLCSYRHLWERPSLDSACLPKQLRCGKHCTCLSSPACPCLYLRMVAQNRWFPDIVKIKKKSQLEVLTVRMQAVACGACAFLLKIDHLWEEPGCIVYPVRLLQHCSCWCIGGYVIQITEFTPLISKQLW